MSESTPDPFEKLKADNASVEAIFGTNAKAIFSEIAQKHPGLGINPHALGEIHIQIDASVREQRQQKRIGKVETSKAMGALRERIVADVEMRIRQLRARERVRMTDGDIASVVGILRHRLEQSIPRGG
jgi:hypothetical protein